MHIYFGEDPINLGDQTKKLTIMFPFSIGKHDMAIKITLEQLEGDELLANYTCGDMMNVAGESIAASHCNEKPLYSICIDLQNKVDETEETIKVEQSQCFGVGCLEHAITVMLQLLLLNGIVLGGRLDFTDQNGDDSPNNKIA